MAAATIGSSKIFPHELTPRLVVMTMEHFKIALGDNLEQRGSRFALQRQVADFVDDQEPRSGEEAHGGGPPSFEGGAVTTCGQIGSRRVVGPIAGVDRGPGETDGQHGLADAGRPDEQHVGGVVEKAQGPELAHQLLVDRWLGGEVEVLESPWRRQAGEAFEAGSPADLGGGHFDLEQASQEIGVPESFLAGMVELAGQPFGGGTRRR